ncbi:Putative CDP-diacylglycerol--glycerol-3-phosphate 3-phosphatidyl-transferase 1 [Bifidobacterium longum subsp. infantis]|nr:Putative CDP-diacylglycerol--glycerol-3-phosphate 3-phosphatidyl-transferase 1 [Bifidobacterium longum subsp. infantis]
MTNQKVNARYSPEARDIYFTVPNLISALRIISIPFISVLISKHEMIAALALIAISSASDGLDGIIARRFNQVSKIGQILDPIADRLLIFCSILALSVAGIIPWWMLIIVGLRDLWMAIQVLWLAQYGYGPLPVHFVGKAGTALLMISIVGLIFADLGTSTFFHLLYIAALAAGIWGIAMYWLAGYIYTKQGVGLLRKELGGRSMALEATAPVSFPVPKETEPVRRRAVFSHSVRGAESHHALSPDDAAAIRTPRRRKTNDDSLQLIDDLVNRPMDPMFSDSRLVHEHRSTFSIWFNRIVVFIICVGVGFACSLFVQQLQSDPRKQVRQTLATQLENRNSQIDELTKDVNNLRSQVDEQSKKISGSVKSDTLIQDEMVNGATVVEGEGITMTLADPIAASQSDQSSSNRVGTSTNIRVITDLDLQQLVSLMFQNGAEAIAINGNRLGAQTSIRKAGGHILIGMTAIQSPYTIEAIGDKSALAEAMGKKKLASLYDSFKEAGIYPQVSKSNSITLEAAVTGEVKYAERNE